MLKFIEAYKKLVLKYILNKKYIRSGKCNMCGACCEKIYVRHIKSVIKDEEEFKKLRFLHPFYTYLEVVDKDDLGLVFKCNNFDKQLKICKIHKKRPGICRRYPAEAIFSMGAYLSDNCGYSFTPIDKFADVLEKERKNYKISDK